MRAGSAADTFRMSELPEPIDIADIVVEAVHGACGETMIAFPAVVRYPTMIVLLAGNIGVPFYDTGNPVGTGGLMFECANPVCGRAAVDLGSEDGWEFAPFQLDTLDYQGFAYVDVLEDVKHVFTAPDNL